MQNTLPFNILPYCKARRLFPKILTILLTRDGFGTPIKSTHIVFTYSMSIESPYIASLAWYLHLCPYWWFLIPVYPTRIWSTGSWTCPSNRHATFWSTLISLFGTLLVLLQYLVGYRTNTRDITYAGHFTCLLHVASLRVLFTVLDQNQQPLII
jgi:hypothetical protein